MLPWCQGGTFCYSCEHILAYGWIIHLWRIKFALASESLTELFFKDPVCIKAEGRCLSCDFSFCCRFIKNSLNTEEKEQCREQGKDLNAKSKAKRSRGTGSKKDVYVGSTKDPLLSTTAAHPAFFQGYAINKAAVGSSVLLSLAICCLFWLPHCLVLALPVTTSFFTDCSCKGMLWLWHANDCLGPAQFSNGTPGASWFVSKVRKLYWIANVSSQN